jgi:hypothetical protein
MKSSDLFLYFVPQTIQDLSGVCDSMLRGLISENRNQNFRFVRINFQRQSHLPAMLTFSPKYESHWKSRSRRSEEQ